MSNSDNTLHVKPRKGLIVRQPERDGEALPARGAKVRRSAYWLRRLRDGDVEPVGGSKQPAPSGGKSSDKKKES